jgi:hypothetical protein
MPSGGQNRKPQHLRKRRRPTERPLDWKKKEKWKPIEYTRYEGIYEVSNMGRIKRRKKKVLGRYRRPKLLKPRLNNNTSITIHIVGHDGATAEVWVKDIVADHWLPNRTPGASVSLIDIRDPYNTSIYNLRETRVPSLAERDLIRYLYKMCIGKTRNIRLKLAAFFQTSPAEVHRIINETSNFEDRRCNVAPEGWKVFEQGQGNQSNPTDASVDLPSTNEDVSHANHPSDGD